MSYSQSQLISDIRRILNDNPFLDPVAEDMDASETGLDVADGTLYSVGGTIEFQDTSGEQCLITSIATDTLTVSRGYNGTTAATHTNGTSMALNPLVQYIQITDAVTASIRGLWPYVYQEVNDTVTPVTGTKWYAMTAATTATISGITNATTAVVTTTAAHGLSVGDRVVISGVTPTAYNGTWVVTAVTSTTFSIYPGAQLGAWSSGGTVTRYNNAAMLEISSATQQTDVTANPIFFYGINRNAYPIDIVFNLPAAVVSTGTGYLIPYLRNTDYDININGIGPLTPTTSGGSYTDFSAGTESDCITYYAVSRLVASLDLSRTTQEDITMGDQTVTPTTRTKLAGYWSDMALAERRKWEMQLGITLPRRKKWGHS